MEGVRVRVEGGGCEGGMREEWHGLIGVWRWGWVGHGHTNFDPQWVPHFCALKFGSRVE